MFFHLFKYRTKIIFHTKEEIFWTLIFPLLLGTCFFAAFSKIQSASENFETINVAIVLDNNESVKTIFDAMSDEANVDSSDDALLHITYCDNEEAKKLLDDKDVTGIITFTGNTPALTVMEEGISASILNEILDKYIQLNSILAKVDPNDINAITSTVKTSMSEVSYISDKKLTNGNTDPMTDYFYSLIAMTCLFGAFSGQSCANGMKANLSSLGMRKNLAPTHRGIIIFADFLATYLLQLVANALLIVYLNYILKVNLGGSFPLIMLTAATGSLIGVSSGIFIGSIPKISDNIKIALITALSLTSSFLSGLMVGGIKYQIDKYAPIINKLNPATVITDALYSLNIYDTYDKFISCMVTLVIYCIVLCTASYFMTRRESYASL